MDSFDSNSLFDLIFSSGYQYERSKEEYTLFYREKDRSCVELYILEEYLTVSTRLASYQYNYGSGCSVKGERQFEVLIPDFFKLLKSDLQDGVSPQYRGAPAPW